MALSVSASVAGSTATIEITCDAGATVSARRRAEFVGVTGTVSPSLGDLVTGAESDLSGVAGVSTVEKYGSRSDNNGIAYTNVRRSLSWLVYAGQTLPAGCRIWRWAAGAPLLGNGYAFFGGSYTNWSIFPPGQAVDGIRDPVDKGITLDAPGMLWVFDVSGTADSWNPPVSFLLDDPVPAPGAPEWPSAPVHVDGNLGGTKSAGSGLTSQSGAGTWVMERPSVGPTGNWYGWIVSSDPWDDGHTWYNASAYAVRPQTFAVTGSGASRQSTVAGLAPGANTVLVSDGASTATLTIDGSTGDVSVVTVYSAPTTDTVFFADSNVIQVKSPAFSAVTDSTGSSDSTSCVLALASTVAVPFLVAASIVAAVLYDTASADTGSFADTVTIARKATHTDAATFAETISIGLGCGAADTGTFSDVAAARIGIYSAKGDTNTFADSVGATLLLVTSGADSTTSSDSNAIEQTFPATVEVSDATTTQDTNSTLAAIGQSDATGSVDTAYAYVGIIAAVSDSTGSSETMSATVYATPPVDVEPIEAVADPVKVGMLAGAGPVGVVAQSVPVGMVYRRNGMQIGKAWQGCDFPVFFPKERDAIGQAVDLAGATLLCSAKIGTESVAASATSVDASAGTGRAVFSAVQTATWPTGVEISFDGVYRLANGRTYPAGTGKFWVADPITPTP